MFSFGDYSKLFWIAILVPGMVALSCIRFKIIKRKLETLSVFKERFQDSFDFVFSSLRFVMKEFFFAVAMVLIVVAVAKPRIGYEYKEVKTSGSDIVVVLDLSKSMYAQDVKPSRIEVAKRKIKDLLSLVRGDRVGVVVFSGSSFVLCPLTQDYSVVDLFLESLDYGTMLVPGTSLDEALLSAISSLNEASWDESQSRSIVLLTDGEDHGAALDKVVESAKENSISIHTMGIGTLQGGPIPLESGGFQQDRSGKIVITKLNQDILRSISEKTSGVSEIVSLDGSEMSRIYYQGILKQDKVQSDDHQKLSATGVTKEKVWNEKYGPFTGVALLLLLVSYFIRPIRRKTT